MVNAEMQQAMVETYANKMGINSLEEARAKMMAQPEFRKLLEDDEVGGISAALARDRHLAYDGGRLEAIEAVLEPHLKHVSAELEQAVDLAAGTAVYTCGFANTWTRFNFFAVEREDSTSTALYPTGLRQTHEALRILDEECRPAHVAPAVEGHSGSGDGGARKLLFVSQGPPRCAVREGDLVTLKGLQSQPELNGRKGIALSARQGGDRFAVQLEGETEPKALKPANLEYEQPGWLHHRASRPAGDIAAAEGELERLRAEVSLLERQAAVSSVTAMEADIEREASWTELLTLMGGQCGLVTCMSLLSQVGHEKPLLWQRALTFAGQLLGHGGVCLLYDTCKYGSFGEPDSMREHGKGVGMMLVEVAEPIEYGDDDQYGRFFACVWKKDRAPGAGKE